MVGGGELSLVELADGLRERGHRPIIAVPGPGDVARDHDRVLVPASVPGLALALRALARECDLVHATGARGVAAAGLANISRPVIWHVRVAARDKLDPVLVRIPDLIVANSHATAARFPGRANVRVIHNGLRAPAAAGRPPGVGPGRLIAVVGRMTPEKGHLDLVPAALALARTNPDIHWWFAGDAATEDGRQLRHALEGADVSCTFAGPVPHAADHLAACALVVIPSRIEGFGRVAAETLMAGAPVMARRVGGLPEVLEGVTDAWLPDEPHDWADAIRRRLSAPGDAPERLRALGVRFSIERHVTEILEAYTELVSG